jgi:outer membrane protein assembly factor BamB
MRQIRSTRRPPATLAPRSVLVFRSLFTLLALPALALALMATGSSAGAAASKSFRQTTAKDFEEGEATASMILPDGTVVPGMRRSPVALDAAFVWCSTISPDGKTAYFGTGDQGRIYAVDVAGGDARARRVATLDAAWVTSLVARPDGTLVAGTTPGGKLFTVDPKKAEKTGGGKANDKGDATGSVRPFATLGTDHVWSLALDAKTGVVYAGTGGPGKIFAVDRSGHAKELWDSGDKHVVSLLQADDKHLLAGTSENAILFRVGLDGHAEALGDFDAEEVRGIARSGNAIYVAVNDFEHAAPALTAGPVPARGTRITVSPTNSPASAGALPRPGQRKAKAALYRIDPDGRTEQIFSIGDGYFTALTVDEDGRAFVGTGTEGRVYRVDADRRSALAIDLPERQALTLLRAGKNFLVGTGDVGGLYRVTPAPAKQATYLSRVLDADFHARWGLLRWHGTHELGVATRSGNTAKPDATWSAFSELDHPRATGDGGVGLVGSPSARYVQYRLSFGAAESHVGEVTLAYLPQNQRARVTEITVGDSSGAAPLTTGGALGALGGAATTTATTRSHSPVIKLHWKVDNTDGDDLVYRLSFREENDAVWRPLGGPEPVTRTDFDWNTEGLPDGSYVVRVVASDERSEPRDRALDSALDSAPILVDNRKPEVAGLVAKYPFVSGRAHDDQSPLTSLEYAIDGGEWQLLSPADGICDDLVEAFTVKLPVLPPGPHAVTVRAWDSADNVGAASVTVRVGSK